MIKALIAYRFLLGIGIGGEYPAGSVGAAEHSGGLKAGTRNRMFIMFTNVQIDFGFVVAPITAMVVVSQILNFTYKGQPLILTNRC
jgi:MFS family permease